MTPIKLATVIFFHPVGTSSQRLSSLALCWKRGRNSNQAVLLVWIEVPNTASGCLFSTTILPSAEVAREN